MTESFENKLSAPIDAIFNGLKKHLNEAKKHGKNFDDAHIANHLIQFFKKENTYLNAGLQKSLTNIGIPTQRANNIVKMVKNGEIKDLYNAGRVRQQALSRKIPNSQSTNRPAPQQARTPQKQPAISRSVIQEITSAFNINDSSLEGIQRWILQNPERTKKLWTFLQHQQHKPLAVVQNIIRHVRNIPQHIVQENAGPSSGIQDQKETTYANLSASSPSGGSYARPAPQRNNNELATLSPERKRFFNLLRRDRHNPNNQEKYWNSCGTGVRFNDAVKRDGFPLTCSSAIHYYFKIMGMSSVKDPQAARHFKKGPEKKQGTWKAGDIVVYDKRLNENGKDIGEHAGVFVGYEKGVPMVWSENLGHGDKGYIGPFVHPMNRLEGVSQPHVYDFNQFK